MNAGGGIGAWLQLVPPPLLGALLLLALGVGIAIYVAARRHRAQVERLKNDIHGLLAQLPQARRPLPVAGRPGDLVDIAASVNRLIARLGEQGLTHQDRGTLFEDLAGILPEVAIVHTDKILFANRAAGDLFGVSSATLLGKPVTDLVRPAFRAALRKHVSSRLADEPLPGAEQPLELQLISGDERGLWVELHSRQVVYDDTPGLLSVAKDITHRKSLEASLGRGKLQARITLESIGEGVVTADRAGIIDYMNEAAEQLIGTTRSVALGKRLVDLIALVDETDRSSLGDPVMRCLAERRRVSLGRRALLMSRQSEREFSVELTASPIRAPDAEIAGCVVIFHDVSEMRGLARQMSYQASHDALTGLVNRAEFERRLQEALKASRAENVSHVVAYLDLDRFKVVNDTSGHMAGDSLLRELAALLKDKIRDSDTVARVGGDEFAMLLIGCPLDKARQIADSICEAVGDYRFVWHDRIFNVGVSVGLVEVGPEAGSAETVLSAADSACYVAKQQGRGRVHVYSARDEIVARQRGEIQWLQLLQRALKENLFELYVQPIISIAGRVKDGPAMEILLRLRDDTGKLVSPAQFLSSAERYQLMGQVDRWVVQTTLTAIGGGALRLPDERCCAINLSGQTLGDEDFLEFVVDVLDRTGVEPGKLCFEVPEAAVVSHLDFAQRFIDVLHGIGCRFALDDFGSGIGSFANLRNLSLDYVKIDGAYIRGLDRDSVSRAMVAAMIELARTLDFQVVAEQVEDATSFEAAREMGFDFVQGYAVERPQPMRTLH